MERRAQKSSTGLAPRLAAALWFALAATVPVAYFFYIMGWIFGRFEDRWLFGVVAIVTATYIGFALGGAIFSMNNAGKAVVRGLLVAFLSYVTLMMLVWAVDTVSTLPPHEQGEFGPMVQEGWLATNPLGWLQFFALGLLFVGFPMAIAGASAGGLLFVIAIPIKRFLGGPSAAGSALTKRTVWVVNAIGLILLLLSPLPVYISRRAALSADLQKRRDIGLVVAARDGNPADVRRFLDEGANIESGEIGGSPPIIWAARGGHSEIIRLLLERGANPNVLERDNQNMTPLHWAATSNNIESVKSLLDYRAEINARTTYGYTPLMLAADTGTPQLVQVLLDHRPNLELRNNERQTALELVKANRSETAIVDTANNDLRADPAIVEKARQRHDRIINLLEAAEAGK